jgi:hypothetical protein
VAPLLPVFGVRKTIGVESIQRDVVVCDSSSWVLVELMVTILIGATRRCERFNLCFVTDMSCNGGDTPILKIVNRQDR